MDKKIKINKNLFKIGEVMEYSSLSRQVIHNYTQLELINEAKRTPSGHRLYGEEVFERIKKIKELRSKGKTLLEIKKILNRQK
ncbi:MAG: MerR family transcriptional regulator [Candidatus Omnitrophota bacterium]